MKTFFFCIFFFILSALSFHISFVIPIPSLFHTDKYLPKKKRCPKTKDKTVFGIKLWYYTLIFSKCVIKGAFFSHKVLGILQNGIFLDLISPCCIQHATIQPKHRITCNKMRRKKKTGGFHFIHQDKCWIVNHNLWIYRLKKG